MPFTTPHQRTSTRLLCLAGIVGLLLTLTGCNTMQGLGKDVEKAGEAIQRSTQ